MPIDLTPEARAALREACEESIRERRYAARTDTLGSDAEEAAYRRFMDAFDEETVLALLDALESAEADRDEARAQRDAVHGDLVRCKEGLFRLLARRCRSGRMDRKGLRELLSGSNVRSALKAWDAHRPRKSMCETSKLKTTVNAPPLASNMLTWMRCADRRYIDVYSGHGMEDGYVGSFAVKTLPGDEDRLAERKGAREALERAVKALWARVEREEYGHAKAAVTLDIEAVRALAAEYAEPEARDGE